MIKLSKRDITIAQRQAEPKVNVEFVLNNDGDIMSWNTASSSGGNEHRQTVGKLLIKKLGYPPYNL